MTSEAAPQAPSPPGDPFDPAYYDFEARLDAIYRRSTAWMVAMFTIQTLVLATAIVATR